MPSKTFSQPWKKWAETWKKMKPPTRPGRKNLQDYKKFLNQAISGKRHPKALLFGATPELRDLLAQYPNIEIVVVDINFEMILAMTELMKHKNKARHEVWLKADWLKAPLREKYFDVLLGDLILENLPKERQAQLFQKAHLLLTKGGYFITRFFAKFSESKIYDFEDLIAVYKKKEVSPQSLENLWGIGVFFAGLVKNGKVNTKFFFEKLKNYIQDSCIQNYFLKLKKILPQEKEWSYFVWQKEKRMIEKYFVIKSGSPEPKSSIAYNWVYIFNLRKK